MISTTAVVGMTMAMTEKNVEIRHNGHKVARFELCFNALWQLMSIQRSILRLKLPCPD